MIQVLSSVNPLWLRLGLETVYEEIIPVNSARGHVDLLRFIAQRLLSDPEIQRRHGHATFKNYIRTEGKNSAGLILFWSN